MATLLEKIEANAQARLVLPPGRTPAQELPRYKAYLKVETLRLKILHRGGGSGREVCHARAVILDALIRHLWDTAKAALSAQAQKEFPPMALIAIGGYGRGELNPHSDIDVMFLHDGQVVAGRRPLPHLSKIIDGILYTLWDVGLKVGHSVRSIDDCVRVANTDMQSKTSLIESRAIAGDTELFAKFEKTVFARCVKGYEAEYIAARVEDQNSRHDKFGRSPLMQEPNVKNGCGGLRDYQNLLWMAFFKHHTRSLNQMQAGDLITDEERKQLEAAYDFLLRTRNELHYHANRAADVLSKHIQPAIASGLGYGDRSPSARIEKFMRDYYTHARNIFLITTTLEQRLALLPPPPPSRLGMLTSFLKRNKPPAEPQSVDGCRFENGFIVASSPRMFREQPRRLMRVFLHLQQRGLKLHPDLAQLIRNQLSLVDRDFLNDVHIRETFLAILDQRGNVAWVLRAMHEVGLLGRYVPEFGRLTCLVQHEFYHQYTADEHTLICLQRLDEVWTSKESSQQSYAQIFQNIERPFVLYLALLLHDTGKASGNGNHIDEGVRLARRAAKRLSLDAATSQLLASLIEYHVLLPQVSQRRDLEDPAVIRRVASKVRSVEALNLLTLLTLADALGTSDKLWNGFKDSLLWSLYHKTLQVLGAGTEFIQSEERQREQLLAAVRSSLGSRVSEEELQGHFRTLPAHYFQIHSASRIAADLELVHRFIKRQFNEEEDSLAPVVAWRNEPDRGHTAVTVCTWDRAGLFGKIAGSMSAAGLNILGAQVFTRADGIVLDTLFVIDARTDTLAKPEARQAAEETLTRALTGKPVDFRALIAKHQGSHTPYQAPPGERMPTSIRFENALDDVPTMIEVETEDRIGLLFAISEAMSELGLDILVAKISTEKGAVFDVFYVIEEDGTKTLSPQRQKAIEARLRKTVAELDG